MDDATHTLIAEAFVDRLQKLNLPNISDSDIALRVLDEDLSICMPGPPGIMVLAVGIEEFNERDGENIAEFFGYPIALVIGDACTGELEARSEINKHLFWRQKIRDAFLHKHDELKSENSAPTTVCDIIWVPGRIFVPQPWRERNMWIGTMAFIARSYETRTS